MISKKEPFKNTSAEHKKKVPLSVNLAVITLSDSRGLEEDLSGDLIQELAEKNNHKVLLRKILPDNASLLETTIRNVIKDQNIQVIITNGGTGLSKKDLTIETIKPMFDKEITGFSSLFWQLGYQQAESSTMLSRATGGIIDRTVIFCLPGSPRACQLALEKLILPEIGHIVRHTNE
ncbi:MAG: MogA/MoaB family molybdenum cofactor biosynthesis protein [Candidatus Aminicenantes bacterium]|nr:MogA/MoaB family molybdenum cofactor biosynthesis protein [Candidatus Aminicenantes bacterium]